MDDTLTAPYSPWRPAPAPLPPPPEDWREQRAAQSAPEPEPEPEPATAFSIAQLIPGTPVTLTCSQCRNSFVLHFPSLAHLVKVCPDCIEAEIRAANKADSIKAWSQTPMNDTSGWERLCPKTFRDTVPHRLPLPTRLQKVLAWKFGPKGLVLHGPTGLGKSRCLFELLKREFKECRTIAILNHSSALAFAALYDGDNSTESVRKWIEHKCSVDILALDDVFKSKLTESFEQALFTIFAQRTERNLPVLLTTNDVGKTLEARMSPDRGPALTRRIRDYCESISFQ